MKRHLQKISITLDPALVDDLDAVSKRLGISRSALIGECLPEALGFMRQLLDTVPVNPTPEDVVRFRGESAGVVRQRVEQLKGIADDLFAE